MILYALLAARAQDATIHQPHSAGTGAALQDAKIAVDKWHLAN